MAVISITTLVAPSCECYEVKADMLCLQCKNCMMHSWMLQRWSHNGVLYKSSFLFISALYVNVSAESGSDWLYQNSTVSYNYYCKHCEWIFVCRFNGQGSQWHRVTSVGRWTVQVQGGQWSWTSGLWCLDYSTLHSSCQLVLLVFLHQEWHPDGKHTTHHTITSFSECCI